MKLFGNMVKLAIVQKLRDIFNNPNIITEPNRIPSSFPVFYVIVNNHIKGDDILDTTWHIYDFLIKYIAANNLDTLLNLDEQLDTIGNELMLKFNNVFFFGDPSKVEGANFYKPGGEGHFEGSIAVRTTRFSGMEDIPDEDVEKLSQIIFSTEKLDIRRS